MIGGFFAIMIALGLLTLVITDTVGLFGPWILLVILVCALLSLVVKLFKRLKAVQVVVTTLSVVVFMTWALVCLPLHLLSVFCMILIALALYASGAMMCSSGNMRVSARVVGAQTLWLGPLTMTLYAYNFVDPSAIVAPLLATVLGVIATIFVAQV
jgi:hypothetical protein